jgi:hypothetical protein
MRDFRARLLGIGSQIFGACQKHMRLCSPAVVAIALGLTHPLTVQYWFGKLGYRLCIRVGIISVPIVNISYFLKDRVGLDYVC